ncbi:WG repeat-containing protein, partial [Roseibium sp.]|uniref:WG repeat-containing protein n=1 Tax=Roseibium sp. TaxID=1936156 RepID=UPI003D11F7DA
LYRINQGWLSEKRYKITYFDEPGRGLIWASEEEGKSPLFGLLKADGSWQVTPRYTKVYWRIGDFATVQGIPVEEDEQTSQAQRVLSGAVDKNGRLVIPLKFEGLSYWRGGYGLARKFGKEPKLGLVSSKGQLLTGRYFDDVDRPTDGRLPRVLKDGQWFSVTADGKLVADERDGHVHVDCPGGLKIIEKQGFFAASHPSLGPPIVTQRATKHTLLSDQLCARPYTLRVQEHQYKFVTQDGRLLPSTGWYDNVYSFDGGLTPVSFNGKWGVIDESGQFLVPPVYDKLSRNRNDSIWFKEPSRTGPAREPAIFRVESNGRQFWIDIHNREVSKPKHPTKEESEAILLCGGVLKRFERTGLWGMKRSDGRVLVEPEYRALTCFRRGTAWGALNGQKFWCPIGTDGKKKASMSCKKYVDVVRITDVRAEEMSKDPYENNVLWLRALLDYAQGKRTEPPGFLGMTF